jgi:hypothetical protein
MDGKKDYITCRLDADLKAKFEEAARHEKRYPAQQLRILVEEYVEKFRPVKRRELATSGK